MTDITAPVTGRGHTPGTMTRLRDAAQKMEAQFLSEMLKSAKFGASTGPFSGGVGEAQYTSFLRGAVADQMVNAGGIGLAETFFEALKESQNGQ